MLSMLTNNQCLENKIWRMLRQKRVFYARKIIEDGFCVNQSAVKRNMEARNNYIFRKNKQECEADQEPLTAPVKMIVLK